MNVYITIYLFPLFQFLVLSIIVLLYSIIIHQHKHVLPFLNGRFSIYLAQENMINKDKILWQFANVHFYKFTFILNLIVSDKVDIKES
jgi:hypothetical protein